MRLGPAGLAPALIAVAVALAPAGPVRAQSYARFAGADSALAPALRAAGAGFEGAWNDLLVSELRARLARADSAARLLDLARGIAAAEPGALGSRIAADALALRDGWSPLQRRVRIRAAATESLAAAATSTAPTASSMPRSPITAAWASGVARRGSSAASA